jgi:4-amino-4-deoxy-L-arabinose transferase-like glycosyltransferase
VRDVLVLLFVALLLRGGWLAATLPTALAGDEIDYHQRAERFAGGWVDKYPGARAPVIETVYARLYRAFGVDPNVARAANVVFGSLLVIPLFALGWQVGGLGVARGSALVGAVFPDFVFFGTYLWSEPLYMLLSTSALALLVFGARRGRAWFAAGVLLGVAALTREVGLLVPFGLAPALLWLVPRPWSRRVVAVVVMLLGFACVVGPWSSYASSKHDGHVWITTTTWFNAYIGNAPDRDIAEDNYKHLGRTPGEREHAARVLARRYVRERMPWWPFEKVAEVVPAMLTPNSFGVNRLIDRSMGREAVFTWSPLDSPAFRYGLAVVTMLATIAVLVLGSAGLVLGRWPRMQILFALFVAVHWAGPLLAFGLSRFRLAFLPVLVVAAVALVLDRQVLWSASGRRQRIVAAVLAAMVFLVSAWQVPGVLRDPVWG